MATETDFGRALDKLVKKATEVLTGPELDAVAEQFARNAATMIVRRTRSGLGVNRDGGSTQGLKPLSPNYVKKRQKSNLSAFTSPGKSNLTFTGELLTSLGIEQRKFGAWDIVFYGTRESGITNAELAGFVSDKGRPFLYLAKDEIAKLKDISRKTFDSLVKSKANR